MADRAMTYSAIGLAAVATPLWAQEFYVGSTFSSGNFTSEGLGFGGSSSAQIQSIDVMGGVRMDVGSGYFLGAEIQGSYGTGYPAFDPEMLENNSITQAEVHFGYTAGSTKFFGFLGTGQTNIDRAPVISGASNPAIVGLGAEFSVSDRAAIRLEAEFSTMSIEDACCGTYDPVKQQDISAGIVFSF